MPYRVVLLLLLALSAPLAGAEPGDPLRIADIHQAGESPYAVSDFLRVGDVAVFVQEKPPGDELWVSDGTAAGTRELGVECVDPDCRIVPGPGDGSRVFFTFAPGDQGVQLGVTDGTPRGTRILTDFGPGHGLSSLGFSKGPAGFLGGRLLFAAEDARGLEPWVTDGTRGGTRLLVDLRPGEDGGFRSWEGVTAGFRMFFADDGVHGTELWSTDGTAMGTVRLGVPPVDPFLFRLSGVAALGSSLVFLLPGDGGDAGRELWGFTTSGETGPCVPAPQTLCVTPDRFRVEVDWHDPRSGDSGSGNVLPGTTLNDSGFFWFFDPANLELVVKVLDARPVNGHFWVFTGSLTDVERRITITDTVTGQVNVYERDAGDPTGQIDVTAF